MEISQQKFWVSKGKNWAVPAVVSLLLLTIVLYQIDFSEFKSIIFNIQPLVLTAGVALLLFEGICTSIRFYFLTPGEMNFVSCLKMTAWYVLYLVILPVRLGEVAGIFLARNYFSLSTGKATMNILIQRIIDISVLSIFFIFTGSLIVLPGYGSQLILLAFFLLSISLGLLIYLDHLLAMAAKLIIKSNSAVNSDKVKSILRLTLQARIWHRRMLNKKILIQAFMITVLKWVSNMLGISIILYGIGLSLNTQQFFFISVIFNFLALIPLQTLGGFGISEAGLTGILLMFNTPSSIAASSAVIARLFFLIVPVLFWLIIVVLFTWLQKLTAK